MVTESSTRIPPKSGKKSPISSHPAFPAIVALWFAALLGIGSLIVPVILFEKLVTITGLSAILPSAQPPLGVTARVIIALGFTGIGIIAGLLLARKVAAAQAAPAPQRFPAAKVPISALEELGAPSLDQPVDEAPFSRSLNADTDAASHGRQRRASLVASESDQGEFLDSAPLPGVAETISDMAANLMPDEDVSTLVEQDEDDALELADIDQTGALIQNAPEPASEDVSGESAPINAEQLISRPLDELGIVQLVERFALSLQTKTPAEVLGTGTLLDAKAEPPFAPELTGNSTGNTADPIQQFPASPAPVMAAMPDALRPIEFGTATGSDQDDGLDEDLDEDHREPEMLDLEAAQDLNCSSLLDMKTAIAAGPAGIRIDDARDQGPASVHAIRSASAPASPAEADESANQEVEIRPRRFDPPQAVPAQESPGADTQAAKVNSAEAELALREALEKLQKMSGVG